MIIIRTFVKSWTADNKGFQQVEIKIHEDGLIGIGGHRINLDDLTEALRYHGVALDKPTITFDDIVDEY